MIQDHYPTQCAICGAPLTPEAAMDDQARQVFDLPETHPLVVTEHRVYSCPCAQCGASTRAAFPEGVTTPVQYGARITAWISSTCSIINSSLKIGWSSLMTDLFGVKLAAATLARMNRSCAVRFQRFTDAVYRLIQTVAVEHLDETDFRVIRSAIATAKKQRWNVTHTLTQPPAQLIAQLRTE